MFLSVSIYETVTAEPSSIVGTTELKHRNEVQNILSALKKLNIWLRAHR